LSGAFTGAIDFFSGFFSRPFLLATGQTENDSETAKRKQMKD
jgi:hypothetical protein